MAAPRRSRRDHCPPLFSLLTMSEGSFAPDSFENLSGFRNSLRSAAKDLRRDLPWICVDDPWAIFVSEVMLQQTSTRRVTEPWRRFLDAFPSAQHCAEAPLADVLKLWSGLGYPRRAKSLHEAARQMVSRFDAHVPSSVEDLLSLPGVGPYTAHAVASFAFGVPVAILDTNVGRILARALAGRALVTREAQGLATALLPRRYSAEFNQAMLDLGAQYCTRRPRCATCPVRGACRFAKEGGDDPAPLSAAVSRPQTPFAGSDRQVRGLVLKALHTRALTRRSLVAKLADIDAARLKRLLQNLENEGLISIEGSRVQLGGGGEAGG